MDGALDTNLTFKVPDRAASSGLIDRPLLQSSWD